MRVPNACMVALAAASLVQAAATVPKSAKAIEYSDDKCHNEVNSLAATFSDTIVVNDASQSIFLTGITYTTYSGVPKDATPNAAKCTGRILESQPVRGCLILREAAGMPNRVKCIQLVQR